MEQEDTFIVDQNQKIRKIRKDRYKIIDDQIYLEDGQAFKIKSHKKRMGHRMYEVQEIVKGGADISTLQSKYNKFLSLVEPQFKQGLQQFLTYQPDIDTSLVQRYGGEEIQEKFDESEIEQLPIENISAEEFYQALFLNPSVQKKQKTRDIATIDALKKYFVLDANKLMDQRDIELTNQINLGTQGGSEDCMCELDFKNYNKCYDYQINLPKDFMKSLIAGKGLGFTISKTEMLNQQYEDKLQFFDQLKQKILLKSGGAELNEDDIKSALKVPQDIMKYIKDCQNLIQKIDEMIKLKDKSKLDELKSEAEMQFKNELIIAIKTLQLSQEEITKIINESNPEEYYMKLNLPVPEPNQMLQDKFKQLSSIETTEVKQPQVVVEHKQQILGMSDEESSSDKSQNDSISISEPSVEEDQIQLGQTFLKYRIVK